MALCDFFETCKLMVKTQFTDPMGGKADKYSEGSEFWAAISTNSQSQASTADRRGLKKSYTMIVNKSVYLAQNDRVLRDKTGEILRIVSDGREVETPMFSSLNCRAVSAEVVE